MVEKIETEALKRDRSSSIEPNIKSQSLTRNNYNRETEAMLIPSLETASKFPRQPNPSVENINKNEIELSFQSSKERKQRNNKRRKSMMPAEYSINV